MVVIGWLAWIGLVVVLLVFVWLVGLALDWVGRRIR
jgi:hypothetical protein